MVEKLVYILLHPKMLARLVALWVVTTVVASAFAISGQSFAAPTAPTSTQGTDAAVLSEEDAPAEEPLLSPYLVPQFPEKIAIPALDKELVVRNPDSRDIAVLDAELMKGVVRHPDSGLLGQKDKTVVIFGHSTQVPGYYGMYRAFNGIETLKEGDEILLYSRNKLYTYRVSRVYHANAATDAVPLKAANNKLILVTCNGFGKKTDRWILEADLVGVGLRP